MSFALIHWYCWRETRTNNLYWLLKARLLCMLKYCNTFESISCKLNGSPSCVARVKIYWITTFVFLIHNQLTIEMVLMCNWCSKWTILGRAVNSRGDNQDCQSVGVSIRHTASWTTGMTQWCNIRSIHSGISLEWETGGDFSPFQLIKFNHFNFMIHV